MKRIGVRLVGVGRAVAEHDYVAALFHVGQELFEIHRADDLDVRDHPHLLVRAVAYRTVQLVSAWRQVNAKLARRASIDRLQLLLDSLPFDLERVWYRSAVLHGDLDFASRDRQLRQLEFPLRETNLYWRRGGASGRWFRRRSAGVTAQIRCDSG